MADSSVKQSAFLRVYISSGFCDRHTFGSMFNVLWLHDWFNSCTQKSSFGRLNIALYSLFCIVLLQASFARLEQKMTVTQGAPGRWLATSTSKPRLRLPVIIFNHRSDCTANTQRSQCVAEPAVGCSFRLEAWKI